MRTFETPRRILTPILYSTFLSIFFSSVASAEQPGSCDSYPYQPLENAIEFDGNGKFKIVATGAASVDFDDPSELMNARREAELIAKRSISEYVNQKFYSEEAIGSEVAQSKTSTKAVDGSTVSDIQRKEVKKQLGKIVGRSDSLLKGVLPIGSCYSKGHEVRVTVGLKSDTIENASQLEKTMGAVSSENYKKETSKTVTDIDKGKSPAPGNSPSSQGDIPSETRKSYDGSKQIKNF